ncbi:MAG TPA: hypothetical protein VNE61_09365 [Ktedonobacteraceae bacterium]|nr:hypothetical protein [Ktedonobacteraceae bacterium]
MSNQPYQPDPRVPDYPGASDQTVPNAPVYGANDTVRSYNNNGIAAQSERESYVDPMGNRVEQHTEVAEDTNLQRANIRYWITRVIYFILGVLEVIMLLRFIFKLLSANAGNGFVAFLYNLSYVFVAPFNSMFTNPSEGKIVFEITTLIAMLVYALVAWGLVALGRLIFAPNYSGRQRVTTTRRNRPL